MRIKQYKLVFTPESIEEIKAIVKWYDAQQKDLGKRFRTNLKQVLANTKKRPFANSFRYDHIRFSIPDKFPYAAHYTIEEEDRKIIIHAVLAFKQDPETSWIKPPTKK